MSWVAELELGDLFHLISGMLKSDRQAVAETFFVLLNRDSSFFHLVLFLSPSDAPDSVGRDLPSHRGTNKCIETKTGRYSR